MTSRKGNATATPPGTQAARLRPSKDYDTTAGGPPAYHKKGLGTTAGEPPAYQVDSTAGGPPAYRVSACQKGHFASKYEKEGISDHSRNYLPHIENQSLQFVTCRLYDSLPKEVVEQFKEMLTEDNLSNEGSKNTKLLALVDRYEDSGYGQCFLKDERIAFIIQENLYHFDGKRYNLINWCIMPNHVHVLIEVLSDNSLSDILHSWRSYTAHKANKVLGRTGQFWMGEYFDRYIRDEEHFQRVNDYITNNPVKAGLVNSPEQWRWSLSGTQAARLRPSKDYEITAGGPPAYQKEAGPPAYREKENLLKP